MKISTQTIREKKGKEPIAALSLYDSLFAHYADLAAIDIILVGDSVGTTVLGFESTVPVTTSMILHHTAAVRRGVKHAFIVSDIPFGEASREPDHLLALSMQFLQEGGAQAVKLEGGSDFADAVRHLVKAGVPVMGHVGLLPQQYYQLGKYRSFGKSASEAKRIVEDATALEEAGAFAIVAEMLNPDTAQLLTESVNVPVIGIGCGGCPCDGQILVSTDLLGMTPGGAPAFVKPYASMGHTIQEAFKHYVTDVKEKGGAT